MTKFIFMILCFATLSTNTTNSSAGSLTIEVTNLRSNNGHVLISLYNDADSFPDKADKAVRNGQVKIKNKIATITFDNLPAGNYAAAVLHDENNNLKMDFNFLGIPKEGYGFSNDAKGTFGPPPFSKASFMHKGGDQIIKIKTNYLL